ncbi:TonB-dependent receptor [Massilia luteola]|uniref:TonB-dependent receptor plug domain-containing protein n=1 Tax=Massilia luteola TaxID=3081751 RepID=UPI002ACC3032|nr:TonB-dependent receptor [Massilia sp. Gc5]
MHPTALRLALAAAFLVPAAGFAQIAPQGDAGAADPGKDKKDKTIQRVEVKGAAADYDPRRDDTASKTVLSAEEIRKYGDDNIFDVLKRAPGVTVTGKTIRMRGLGAGYTQILVNGDRPPPGFSLDALTPDQIERIEVIRAASAEYSMQAIAGTINIVLRKVVSKPQRDLRLNATRSTLQRSGTVGGTWGEKVGSLSYFVNGTAFGGHNDFYSRGSDRLTQQDGQLAQARVSNYRGGGAYRGIVLFPRVNWKIDDANELNLSAGLQASSHAWSGMSHNDVLVGAFGDPDWIDMPGRTSGDQWMMRGELGWIAKVGGGKLELTLAGERSRDDNDNVTDYFSAGRIHHLARDWDTVARPRRTSLRGKFTRSLFDGHALAAGVDASRQRNDDTRDRRDQQDDAPETHVVEGYQPEVTRLAAFAQDEWNVTKQWSIYLGGRWEGVRTDSAATGVAATASRSHVLGPVAQTLYKFPDKSGRQLRLALTRTYKAPTVDQLTARRYLAPLNTRFSPDSSGNPALRPELANGIDVAFEQYWPEGAMVSVSGTQRLVSDYIRTRLDLDPDGRWIYRPLNDGGARVHALEAEVKLPLRMVSPAAAGFDMRAAVTRNWSEVDVVPGPGNRLDAQTPMSANVGLDYRRDRLTFGASMAYQQGGWVRVSEAQSRRQQTRRDVDAYAAWKLDPHVQLRLTLNNLLGMDNTSESSYEDASGLSRQAGWQRGATRVGLNVEMKM